MTPPADQQAVQRESEDAARAAVERVLGEFGCTRPDLAGPRIHQIYLGHFELRARRLGLEYCPDHPNTRQPCWCTPISRNQEDT
jgi:hypothetical protein